MYLCVRVCFVLRGLGKLEAVKYYRLDYGVFMAEDEVGGGSNLI